LTHNSQSIEEHHALDAQPIVRYPLQPSLNANGSVHATSMRLLRVLVSSFLTCWILSSHPLNHLRIPRRNNRLLEQIELKGSLYGQLFSELAHPRRSSPMSGTIVPAFPLISWNCYVSVITSLQTFRYGSDRDLTIK
jgi:hypothetical protein